MSKSKHYIKITEQIDQKRRDLGAENQWYFVYLQRNIRRLRRNITEYNRQLGDLEVIPEHLWDRAIQEEYDRLYREYIMDSEALEAFETAFKGVQV